MKLKTAYAYFNGKEINVISKEKFKEYKKDALQLSKEGKQLYTIKYKNQQHLKDTLFEILNEIYYYRAMKELYESILKEVE